MPKSSNDLDIEKPFAIPIGTARAQIKEKGSRFEGFAGPIAHADAFSTWLAQIKKDCPGATHYCTAYRLDPISGAYRVNDDGEPSGSAGLPIFNAIQSAGIYQVGVVVVRFYGGTKLGVPGLIASYRDAAKAALGTLTTKEVFISSAFQIEFDYEQIGPLTYLLEGHHSKILDKHFGANCIWRVRIPLFLVSQVLAKIPRGIRIFETE
jgi:putative IMPACT (imprinted ancient) family translation regulator